MRKIFKCDICGSVVEMIHDGQQPFCCGQPMRELEEKFVEGDKHVPVIERTDDGYLVRVGSVPHPMEEDHYIEWIELIVDGVMHRKFLKPGDKPEAMFKVTEGEDVKAREFCMKHELWKGKV